MIFIMKIIMHGQLRPRYLGPSAVQRKLHVADPGLLMICFAALLSGWHTPTIHVVETLVSESAGPGNKKLNKQIEFI